MLPQEVMIERVRELCDKDERVVAALMYASFALGEGDRFSDIEFYLFFEDEATEGLHEEAWVAQIAPLYLYYVNEFGNGTAIFENLVRGEFHFEVTSNDGLVDAWESAWFPSLESAVLVDKGGELSARVGRLIRRQPEMDTPERVLFLCRSLMNWTLMAANQIFVFESPATPILPARGGYPVGPSLDLSARVATFSRANGDTAFLDGLRTPRPARTVGGKARLRNRRSRDGGVNVLRESGEGLDGTRYG